MKVLIIGGTGIISSAVSSYAIDLGMEVYLLNRGNHNELVPKGAKVITCDIDSKEIIGHLEDLYFDTVVDFIAFKPIHIERDYQLFKNKTRQYIFISSAAAYQKPLASPVITESTPLSNPYWDYAGSKIDCEELLKVLYRKKSFPITIVRPSHTYGNTFIPVTLNGRKGGFSVLERIRQGKKVIVPGDGTSLWTLTHNTDFAMGFAGLIGNIHAIGETYHITSDEILTWNQIYETLGMALGIETNIIHIATDTLAELSRDFYCGIKGERGHSVIFDNRKIKKAVPDFKAKVRFDQGARCMVDYIYKHEEYHVKDEEFDVWCDKTIELYEQLISQLPKYP